MTDSGKGAAWKLFVVLCASVQVCDWCMWCFVPQDVDAWVHSAVHCMGKVTVNGVNLLHIQARTPPVALLLWDQAVCLHLAKDGRVV
eukprot:CAMPEP_0174289920 /NCGR_PEP_ID=MMETSP0809-20121228/26885_1 /TAXON_ID=73025 ORGANISM="Eutreptiella gymnastica-like, Strain CCMP1594" /NCGR_SAMPLE_ID=MMETSP0809 /ASSEMBLY_ACC=CAM_ASM_000658 /LENGTH=86 /DNA_ID=CAMNT_0015388213 /DNA_START=538 /DNA_END=795 /DNA_ORIENTATION=+